MRIHEMILAAGLVAGLCGVAGAQGRESPWVSFSPHQTAIAAGAGVVDYVGAAMRDTTELGANWDARITFGTRSFLAFEAGYMGTYNKFNSPNEAAPFVINHSVDTDLRINFTRRRVQPYIFGGVGYNRATANNLQDAPGMSARFNVADNNLLVPAGAGLAGYIGRRHMIDARGTYRVLFDQDLDRLNPDARLDQWTVTARYGVAF